MRKNNTFLLERSIMSKKIRSLKEYLGLPTISIGGLDSYHPIASLGDLPPRGRGSRDSRVTGLQANYDTQAPGTMRPFLTAQKVKTPAVKPDKRSTGEKNVKEELSPFKKKILQKLSKPIKDYNKKKESVEENTFDTIKVKASKWFKDLVNKVRRIATTSKRYEYAAKVLQDVIDRKKRERYPQPLRHDIGYYASVVADTFHDIDSKKLQSMVHEDTNRIPRKKGQPVGDVSTKRLKKEDTNRVPRKPGQPAGSDKHSDLYTDENPKGTIQGLGFTDAETAKQSVNKIKNSNRSHAHKIQAAIAMSQRAKVASERAKDPQKKKDLGAAHKVYQSFIDTNKKEK